MSVGASDSAGHLEGSAAIFASAFRGQWKPVYRSMSYRLAIAASAAFVLLMPLVYFATIGGIGWLVYWHLTNDTGLLHTRTSGRAVLVPLFLYIVPAIVGCVLILFLLKPILYFFMGPSEEDAIEIFPSEEPRLFGFVAAVCNTMGAPVPERIFIDCTPNAAAQLLGGPLGMLGRSRLGLHIGLPLVAGMNATNFAGVLAHEFGHFSQGAGMRATNILGRITQWMMIAAYAPDGLDEKIAELGKSGNAYLAILALVLTMCLGIARLVLKIVLFSGYGLARVMGRRMEFDADAHEVRFVGSKAAIDTWPQIIGLGMAAEQADAKLAEHWKNRKLPEDLPAFIASVARRLSPDSKAAIKRHTEERHTGWFDSHPATGVRIETMRKLDEPGVFKLDEPATTLFTNFRDASRRASYNYFKAKVGEYIQSATFVTADQIFGSSEAESARGAAAETYLGYESPDCRPLMLGLSELHPTEDPKATWEKLRQARSSLKAAAPAAAAAVSSYLEADTKLLHVEAAPALFAVGISKIPREMQYSFSSPPGLGKVKVEANENASMAAAAIDEANDFANVRIACALRLLVTKGIEKKVPNADRLRARAAELVRAHAALRDKFNTVRDLRTDLERVKLLAPHFASDKLRDKVKEQIRPMSDQIRDRVLGLRQDLGGIPSPYPGVDGQTNLGNMVAPSSPAWREFDQIFPAGFETLEKYAETQRRVLHEMIEIAANLEAALQSPARTAPDRAAGGPAGRA